MNCINISGYVTKEINLRVIGKKQTPLLNFNVAVNKNFLNESTGKWEKNTSYFTISVFGTYANSLHKNLKKGLLVFITGELSQSKYIDKNTSRIHYATNIIAKKVEITKQANQKSS